MPGGVGLECPRWREGRCKGPGVHWRDRGGCVAGGERGKVIVKTETRRETMAQPLEGLGLFSGGGGGLGGRGGEQGRLSFVFFVFLFFPHLSFNRTVHTAAWR